MGFKLNQLHSLESVALPRRCLLTACILQREELIMSLCYQPIVLIVSSFNYVGMCFTTTWLLLSCKTCDSLSSSGKQTDPHFLYLEEAMKCVEWHRNITSLPLPPHSRPKQ